MNILSEDILQEKIEQGRVVILFIDAYGNFLKHLSSAEHKKFINGLENLLEKIECKIPALHIGTSRPDIFRVFVDGQPVQHTKWTGIDPENPVFPYAIPEGQAYHIKQHEDAFYQTNLEKRLYDAGIDTVLCVGVYAEHCVLSTGRQAFFRGLHVGFISDFIRGHIDCSPHDEARYAIHKDLYKRYGCTVRWGWLHSVLNEMAPRPGGSSLLFCKRHAHLIL